MSYQQPLSIRSAALRAVQPSITLASAAFVVLATIAAVPHAHAAEAKKKPTDEQADVTQLEGVTATATKTEPGSNPNADSEAPYKVDKSANSKFTEPLLNVSKTINVVGKEQMKDANVTALKDLMRTQAGVTLGTGEGGNAAGDRFFIRGFDSRNDMFVDGVRDPGVTTRDVFATEQVEIAKGASSTFAGRGTTGGAVNSVSKKPQNTNFSRATVTVGDDNRVALDSNRVVNEKLKVRANIMAEDSTVAGRDEVYKKGNGIALAADYQANDKVDVLVDYYHLEGENMPDYGIPWDTTTNQPANVDRSNFYGVKGRDFQETSADILTGTVDVKLSDNTKLTSKTRVGETTNDYVAGAPERADMTAGTVSSNAKSGGYTNKTIANNTQLTHERHVGNVEHTIVGGFDISNDQVTNQPFDTTLKTATLNLANPNNDQGSVTVTRRNGESKLDAQSRSLYVMDTAKFNEKWQAFGGVRYDTFKIDNQPFNYTTGAVSSPAHFEEGFTNGHVGVTYKPQENGSIYGSVSTSSNLPGEMYDGVGDVAYGGLVADLENYKPEKNKSLEIGTKWNLANDNLMLTAAAFQTDKSNKIEAMRSGSVTTYSQTGKVRIKGVEVGASGNVTPKLSLAGGAVAMHSKVSESVDPNAVGKDVANIAEKSANIQAKYQATPKLAVGGTVVHTGKIKGGVLAATTEREIPHSNRLDLMAEYKINKKLSTQVNVKNATDKTIYEALYRSSAPFVYVAPGRSTNVSLTYDF